MPCVDGLDEGQVVEEDVCVEHKQRRRGYRERRHGEDMARRYAEGAEGDGRRKSGKTWKFGQSVKWGNAASVALARAVPPPS